MLNKINILNILKLILILILIFLFLPYLNIILLSFKPNSRYLIFIYKNGFLFDYMKNTLEMILKVGFFASLLGFFGAYFMAFYSFKFKRLINLFFILPLSIPIYLGAYVYSDLYLKYPILEFLLKNKFTMNSTVFIYVIFLYPYVYLTTYAYLKNHLQEYIEAGQVLNLSNRQILQKIIFPLTKTVVFSSSLFVIYESLSDFAVSEYYGTLTLSKAFNDAWLMGADQSTSAKLALALLFILAFIISIEKLLRKKTRLVASFNSKGKLFETSKKAKIIIYSFYAIIITLGFILPLQRIMKGAIRNYQYYFKRDTLNVTIQTFLTSLYVIVFILIIAMFLTFMLKYISLKSQKKLSLIATLGYMMPSMILSLGLYALFFKVDLFINPILKNFDIKTYIFTSSSLMLIIGLGFKFLAVAYNNFEQTYKKINPSIFEAGLMLGKNPIKIFFKIDLFFLTKTSFFIIILVILDVFKELTISFPLSPFNFRTISMEIYHYMTNEMQQVAYVPGSIIIFVCILCILILERGLLNDKNKELDI